MQYKTSRGVTVEILAIQTLLEKFEAASRLPKVPEELRAILGDAMPKPGAPTYDVRTITGKVETWLHDETTVESEAEKAIWAQYQTELAAYEADRGAKLKRLVFLHGLRVEMPADDGWARAQSSLGITPPPEPTERKMHYIETEVCGGVGDFMEILKLCTMAGLPEEKFREAEELFRREITDRLTAARIGHAAKPVDSQLPVRAGGGGAPGGPTAAE